MSKTIFRAADVFLREGFDDGDLLHDLLRDGGLIESPCMGRLCDLTLEHDILATIVETVVIEAGERIGMPAVPLQRIETNHNPIRFKGAPDDGRRLKGQWSGIEFAVSNDQILEIGTEIADARRAHLLAVMRKSGTVH